MSEEAFRPFCHVSYYVITCWYLGIGYNNDFHYFPSFFLTERYAGQRWYSRWVRYIRVTYTLTESVRLCDQSDVEVDKKGVHDDSSNDVRSLVGFTSKEP